MAMCEPRGDVWTLHVCKSLETCGEAPEVKRVERGALRKR